MAFSKRITIERYKDGDATGCAGLIEGETDSGDRWILFLDADGKPEVYWPEREPETGAVVGDGISLKSAWDIIHSQLKVTEDEELISTFPVWSDGMRGIIFAVSASQHPRDNTWTRMLHFVSRLYHEVDPEIGRPRDHEGWEISDEDREAARFKSAAECGDPGLGDGADHASLAGAVADPGDWEAVEDDLGDQSGVTQV